MHYRIYFTVYAVFIYATSDCMAAKAFGKFYDEANPKKCTFGNYNKILEPRTEAILKTHCGKLVCLNGDGLGGIHFCSPYEIPKGCILGDVKYPTKDYPQCCEPRVYCLNT